MANKDEFLRIVKSGDGGHIAFAVNATAPNIILLPEKLRDHLVALYILDREDAGWVKVFLYLDNSTYMRIHIDYDKETKQIINTEVDFNHLAECYCGE